MRLTELNFDQGALEDVCRKYHVRKLEAFGSFASGDATEDSDVDLLVTFQPDSNIGWAFADLQQALARVLDRDVDLITRFAVERSDNRYFKQFVLDRVEPVYLSDG